MPAKLQNKTATGSYYHYSPPDIPMGAIRRLAMRIADRFDPERIILFGSYAYGKAHEWSDVDLLVVMPTRDEIRQAIRIKLAFEREFPLDLIVRTPKRLHFWLAQGDSFLQEITTRGIVLYEKDNPGMGKKGRKRPARRSK
jgi:uncharacterized protein